MDQWLEGFVYGVLLSTVVDVMVGVVVYEMRKSRKKGGVKDEG